MFKNFDARGRDLRKLLIWKPTTGLGYSRKVLVCSEKFARVFCELKNRTIDTLVATSTESTSLPMMNGLAGGGAMGLGWRDPCVDTELLWLLLPDGIGGSWKGNRALETLWKRGFCFLLLGVIVEKL